MIALHLFGGASCQRMRRNKNSSERWDQSEQVNRLKLLGVYIIIYIKIYYNIIYYYYLYYILRYISEVRRSAFGRLLARTSEQGTSRRNEQVQSCAKSEVIIQQYVQNIVALFVQIVE